MTTTRTLTLLFVIVFITIFTNLSVVDAKSVFQPVTKPLQKLLNGKLQQQQVDPFQLATLEKQLDVVADTTAVSESSNSPGVLRLFLLFTTWYAFNAGYNVFNSHLKSDFKFPWTSSTLQLIIGLFYAIPLWFFKIRKIPNLTVDDILKLLPIALLNALGHVTAVIAMFEKGGGSFTHVIKASEPVVSVILSFFINGIIPKPLTALSLLPITYGVAYASTLGNINVNSISKELTSKAAKMAMASNIALSLRSIFRKNLPKGFKEKTNLDAANERALTTFLSSVLLIPFVLYFERVPKVWESVRSLADPTRMLQNLLFSGITFYFYNELQNIVLSSLGPVPTAVGNTLKRVVIFVALYFFTKGEEFPLPKIIGCAIAILGCLGFAIFDSKKM